MPSDDTPEPKHSQSGTYQLLDLVPEAAQQLTLEQVLALLVSMIVSRPDDVEVVVVNSGRIKVVEFDVHPQDRGQLLGRSGYTIHALRTISKAILGPLTKRFSYRIDMTGDDAARRR